MHAELTVSREDYLKAIIEAESEGHAVVPVLLSHWLGVSPPAVTKALKRLREDGFVEDAAGCLRLTQKGRQVAHRTASRHYLVERMLSEIFGMEWHQIHAEAERLEHVISPEFEAKLIEKLGFEAECPHGNRVLPETPEQIRERGLLALSDAAEGEVYTVARLYERDGRLLSFLHKLGIGPQTTLQVLERNYDQTLRLQIAGQEITLGTSAAAKVYVRGSSKLR
ncbi:MAG TPA: metal-dependent transcriptional regulator [Acidobacteriaceae bacterium]|nr:metal-dependent transcriptional regulator [Acidobacteriaceae bacterium]